MSKTKKLSIGGRVAAAATFLPRITKTLSSLGLINSYDEKDEFSLSEFAGTTHNASTDQNPPIDSKTKWISSFIELLPDPVALVSKSGNVFHVNKKFCLALKASAPTLLKDCNLLDLLHDRDRHKVLAGLDKCYILKDVVELIQVRCCTLGKLTSNYFECSLLLSSHGDDNMILVVLRRHAVGAHPDDSTIKRCKSSTSVASMAHLEPLIMVHSSEYRKLSVSYSPSSKGSAQSSLEAIIEQQETLPLIAATQEADEYRKKLQQKSLFVRSASHEIRTHLNVVLAALLWLELESVKQPKIFHDTIQLTKDACTSAVDIQNDLLAYEKLDENILTVESSPILIAILVEGMIKPFSIQARQKQIRIMLEETEGMRDIFVSADEYKLAQVLRNLLANAVKFTLPNGTITVKVTRIVKESKEEGPKDWIRLEVIDDGFGLTKENQDKLFGEIIQFAAKEQQQGGGSGLGLFISKGITDLMGGNLGVFSRGLGHGSTFSLELPIVSSPFAALKPKILLDVTKCIIIDSECAPPDVQSLLDLYGFRRKVKLLIVDDSVFCRKMVSQLLVKFYVECEEAMDGEDAVKKISAAMNGDDKGFDGIIVDGEMPKMDGLQAVTAIRGLGFTGRIYGCTGDTNPKTEAAFVAVGANRSYLKPLTHMNFTSMLRDLSESLILDALSVEKTTKSAEDNC